MPQLGLPERLKPERLLSQPQAAVAADKLTQRRIPRRIAEAVNLLLTGEVTTQRAAAERVGMTPQHLCKMLSRDNVRVFIERRSRQTIAQGLMRASARLVDLVDAGSEHVSLDATKHLLGISGIAPVIQSHSVNVNVDVKAGYVIDLSENPWKAEITEQQQQAECPPVGQPDDK